MIKKLKILWNWLRGYNFGDPRLNGEYYFLKRILRHKMTIFDVGANVGEYATFILSVTPQVDLHCFEPVSTTYNKLQQRLTEQGTIGQVMLNFMGLSDQPAKAAIKVFGETAGTNSLYERKSAIADHPIFADFREEEISLTTLDDYVMRHSIKRIDLLKIDVEGHELKVLYGAEKSLNLGIIKAIQFEYGGCFLDAGIRLEQIYDLLRSHDYDIFRLWPFGRIAVRTFDASLENYQYSNWVAIYRKDPHELRQ